MQVEFARCLPPCLAGPLAELEEVDVFLLPLPVGRLPGVGKVTDEKLAKLRIQTIGELRGLNLPVLEQHFGHYGVRLHELARGIDETPVVPDRPTKSISVEDTFDHDVPLSELEPTIRRLAEKLWSASRKENRTARTVVLKLKTSEFKILTRSHTPSSPPTSCEELTAIALKLREHVDLGSQQRYRLVGVVEQLSRTRRRHGTARAFPMKAYQSAAAALTGCCFIISSMPFFISLALGSALCVPTIHE